MLKFFKWLFNILNAGIKRVTRPLIFAPLIIEDEQHGPDVLLPILNHSGRYVFFCPGCNANHVIDTTPTKNRAYHRLTGSLSHPTIRASVMSNPNYSPGKPRCHSFITDGVIEYLSDSTHHLAGKKVNLSPL